jgi:hypothetical protein
MQPKAEHWEHVGPVDPVGREAPVVFVDPVVRVDPEGI